MLTEAFIGLIDAGILKRAVDGVVLHGAFFLGPKSFYRALREMSPDQIARIQMMPVSFTNELYGEEERKRRARIDARFINNTMMATLLGAAVSDGLDNGQVVSGVGGQYNFVAQAFALEGARSVLTLEATRQAGPFAQIQHSLALWARNDPAAPPRCVRYRVWRCRFEGKVGCRRHRRYADDRGFTLSGRIGSGREGRRQIAAQLRYSCRSPRKPSRADRRSTQARARCRAAAVVPVRLRFH